MDTPPCPAQDRPSAPDSQALPATRATTPLAVDLSRFHCKRCGACCRVPGGIVRLREDDIAPLAAALGLDEPSFLDRHAALAPDRRSLVLRDAPDGSCEMLDANGQCQVHAAKPRQCRDFPSAWTNPDSLAVCPALRECVLTSPHSVHAP